MADTTFFDCLMSTPICDTQWGETLMSVRNSRSWFMLSANSGLDVLYLHRCTARHPQTGRARGTAASQARWAKSLARLTTGDMEGRKWGRGETQVGA